MKILVLNAGSSSLKYCLFEMDSHAQLITGLVERIGESAAEHGYCLANAQPQHDVQTIADHQQALQQVFKLLFTSGLLADKQDLFCIGHRVVHGGEDFRQPALITAEVMAQIANLSALAPLHNPANLLGIHQAIQQMGDIPQVAVFDTAFHHTLPEYAFRYALPDYLYSQHGVRRYGFHGTSHGFVAKQAAIYLNKPLDTLNLISLHLGNGASVCAIANGKSVDTSMGMTPLEGLMMGSRCGDIDPAIGFYLQRTLGMSAAEAENLLNKASGCKGICGENDMRAIHQRADAGDKSALLALTMYAYRLKKYIGGYFAVLGRVDALIFTGGIGEHDAWMRAACCADLSVLGIAIDEFKNQQPGHPCGVVSDKNSTVKLLVIATNEELAIAEQALECLSISKAG